MIGVQQIKLRKDESSACEIPPVIINDANILLQALQKICEMNYQQAEDQYGDRNKAKTWSCVKTAEDAIAKYFNL